MQNFGMTSLYAFVTSEEDVKMSQAFRVSKS